MAENDFDLTNADDLAKLEQFIDYCASNGHNAIIVLPTFRYFVDGSVSSAAQAEIQTYVRHVLDLAETNGVSIYGFEIGNEFYQDQFNWSNAEFAQLQAQLADWVHDEIGEDADIYIQAGRADVANEVILDAFTQSSTDDLDHQ